MTGISNGFDHYHLHSGGTKMSLCKLHECFANARPPELWPAG